MAGTVGEPGQRTFFLQARGGGRITSVALEKQQVAVLAERVEALLDEVLRRSAGEAGRPRGHARSRSTDSAPLDAPIEEEFRVGTMALAWDGDDERVVIEAQALVEEAEDGEPPLIDADDQVDGPPLLRVRLTGAAARAFVHAGPGRRRRRPAAVPVLRRPARPGRARLPARQRLPPLRRR